MKVETVAYAMEDQGVALQVETAGQAVLAALNWNSSPEARQQALAYLESVRLSIVVLSIGYRRCRDFRSCCSDECIPVVIDSFSSCGRDVL